MCTQNITKISSDIPGKKLNSLRKESSVFCSHQKLRKQDGQDAREWGKYINTQSMWTARQDLCWASSYRLMSQLEEPLHQSWMRSEFSVFFFTWAWLGLMEIRSVVKNWAKHIEDNGVFDGLRWFYMDFYYHDGQISCVCTNCHVYSLLDEKQQHVPQKL